jgi:hypothetical protein
VRHARVRIQLLKEIESAFGRLLKHTFLITVAMVMSHPVFKPKPNAHSMCAQESSLHTYRIENGDRITNVSI